ncbi:MAG: alpha/beta hydrolase [Clostridiales bacterium]|nr:alpha/beta hydrolase [Clostridiales bacterium]
MKAILHALSYSDMELESSRRLADLKKLDPVRIFCRKLDAEAYNGDYKVPLRLYFPSEEVMTDMEKACDQRDEAAAGSASCPMSTLLFFHGGGWVTESVENYDRVCARMAQATGHLVVSVEYRLAPEHPFPTGLRDCYAAARALSMGELYWERPADTEEQQTETIVSRAHRIPLRSASNETSQKDLQKNLQNTKPALLRVPAGGLTVIGDSAGGNLAAALSLMVRDTGEFQIERQILIYPALNNCYTEESEFASVQENGDGYLLTAKKMERYLDLYERVPEDRQNPYFAPILANDLQNMPRTLILTAEYDPLRDEGEAYGERLRAAGNDVEMHRITDALHGFFALGIKFWHVQESFDYINGFLENKENESFQPVRNG